MGREGGESECMWMVWVVWVVGVWGGREEGAVLEIRMVDVMGWHCYCPPTHSAATAAHSHAAGAPPQPGVCARRFVTCFPFRAIPFGCFIFIPTSFPRPLHFPLSSPFPALQCLTVT